jgi:hypothetical protein
MQASCAYLVGQGGHIIRCIYPICEDDEIAQERAKQLMNGHEIEVWQGDRDDCVDLA